VLVGALVNGIKASIFGGIPGALVGGLILDKFLGVKEFHQTGRNWSIDSIRRIKEYYGVELECELPTWLGSNMDEVIRYRDMRVSCDWKLSEEWVLATLVIGITSAFWVYRYLSKSS